MLWDTKGTGSDERSERFQPLIAGGDAQMGRDEPQEGAAERWIAQGGRWSLWLLRGAGTETIFHWLWNTGPQNPPHPHISACFTVQARAKLGFQHRN